MALAGVRAVDIGPRGAPGVQVQPLLPEQKVLVTRPLSPASGNGA